MTITGGDGGDSGDTAVAAFEYVDARPLFSQLTGPEKLAFQDEFWLRLLACNFKLSEFSSTELESITEHCCNDLATHNPQTNNYITLVSRKLRC